MRNPFVLGPMEQFATLVCGVRRFFGTARMGRALVGLSGGLDSALVLVVAQQALGAEAVRAIYLPTQYSSSMSGEDAAALAKRLGVSYQEMGIDTLRNVAEPMLETLCPATEPGVSSENLQSRLRAVLLMGVANREGRLLLNTSNRSEILVGYSTMYGDTCGALSVIGDLYKSEVYAIAKAINREGLPSLGNGEVIPSRIITRPPSAELRPNQVDTDSLPPYDILDPILRHLTEGEELPKGVDAALVERVRGLWRSTDFKRSQFPPIMKVL